MKVGGQRWIDGTDARMENEGVETHKEGEGTYHSFRINETRRGVV